jgi:pimeloyl-ACP methyl ester carboxylesterase
MVRPDSRRRVAAMVVGVLLAGLAAFTGSTASTAAVPVAATARPLTWTSCRDGFQCTTAFAPLDYNQPDGVKVGVSLIRLPAGNPRQRIGSLLLNPGGPGGSGVDFARGVAQFLPLELRSRFDIVGFDPRGILRSTPLRCFNTFEQAVDVLPMFAFPLTAGEERAQGRSDRTLARACDHHGGPILAHMSTADVARDMDFVRQSLGEAKLTYLGFSYGSFLGQVYANLFPNRVRALVIDGVLDPIAWTTGRGQQARTTPFGVRLHSDDGALRTLGEFFRLCDAAGSDCAFSGNSRHRYARLTAELRKKPLQDESGDKITYADLVGITLGAMYDPSVWPDAAQFFADLERQAKPATLTRSRARLRADLGLAAATQEQYPNVVEGAVGVICSDSVNPHSFTAWRRAAHTAAKQVRYFGRAWAWVASACAQWPTGVGADRYLGPWTARTSSPVLVVGNFFDPATRYQGAVTASRLLPNSRLLSYAGWGHTAYFGRGNFCINDHVTRYLVTTVTPPAGTICAPEGSPFGPTQATALARQAARSAAALNRVTLPQVVRNSLPPAAR